jgi:tripartite-type tricarboxylate transporter receptor subunit TctC
MSHVKGGTLRILALSSSKRSPLVPDVPTVAELMLPGFDFTIWGGLFVKKDTPPEVFQQLQKAVIEARNSPELQAYREAQRSIKAPDMTPQEVSKFFDSEVARYRAMVKATGLQAE